MILKLLLSILYEWFANFINLIIPSGLPGLSEDVMLRIYAYLDLLDNSAAFITFFIPPEAFRVGFKAFLLLFSVEKIWPLLMWIVRKIPFLHIS